MSESPGSYFCRFCKLSLQMMHSICLHLKSSSLLILFIYLVFLGSCSFYFVELLPNSLYLI